MIFYKMHAITKKINKKEPQKKYNKHKKHMKQSKGPQQESSITFSAIICQWCD